MKKDHNLSPIRIYDSKPVTDALDRIIDICEREIETINDKEKIAEIAGVIDHALELKKLVTRFRQLQEENNA